MPDTAAIHAFALLWFDKFRDVKTAAAELCDHTFADACVSFSFDLDCGNAFGEVYPEAFNTYAALAGMIDQVEDIAPLGSTIFSKWRSYAQGACAPAEIAAPEGRAWFITALSRLERLTADGAASAFLFEGRAKEAVLVSHCIASGPTPQPEDEVEQRLTLAADGAATVTFCRYGDARGYIKSQHRDLTLLADMGASLLNRIGAYFTDEYDAAFDADAGDWTLSITNTDDVTYHFRGSLCSLCPALNRLSSDLRQGLNLPDLLAFDGDAHHDRIERLAIHYHRVTKIKPNVPFHETMEYVTWDYAEQIVIDRASETLEYVRNVGSGCKILSQFYVQDGIASFLDEQYSPDFLMHIKGNAPDVVEDPMETKDYQITVDFLHGAQRILAGSFDKHGLPMDYPDLADNIFDFMYFYRAGELLNPYLFSKLRRTTTGSIFCSVAFHEGGKLYYYLTDDETLAVGDVVVVPVGNHERRSTATIVKIESFAAEDVPYPMDRVKVVIGRYVEDGAPDDPQSESEEPPLLLPDVQTQIL